MVVELVVQLKTLCLVEGRKNWTMVSMLYRFQHYQLADVSKFPKHDIFGYFLIPLQSTILATPSPSWISPVLPWKFLNFGSHNASRQLSENWNRLTLLFLMKSLVNAKLVFRISFYHFRLIIWLTELCICNPVSAKWNCHVLDEIWTDLPGPAFLDLKQVSPHSFVQGAMHIVTWSYRSLSFHSNLLHTERIESTDRHMPWRAGERSVKSIVAIELLPAAFAILSHFQSLVHLLPFVEVVKVWNDDRNRKCDGQNAWDGADWANDFTPKGQWRHITVPGKGKKIDEKILYIFTTVNDELFFFVYPSEFVDNRAKDGLAPRNR